MKVVDVSDLVEFSLFDSVKGKMVFTSDKVMFMLVTILSKGVVPEHSHPHEQMGVCLKGKALFKSEKSHIVEEGIFYWIAPGEKHSVISLVDESSVFIDVFNSPREDYLVRIKEP